MSLSVFLSPQMGLSLIVVFPGPTCFLRFRHPDKQIALNQYKSHYSMMGDIAGQERISFSEMTESFKLFFKN